MAAAQPAGLFIAAAIDRTTDRGLRRTLRASIRFLQPCTTKGVPRFIARYASLATSDEDITPDRNRRVLPLPATEANSVAVAPGRLTVAVTPVPFSSWDSASVNEFTKALVA